MHAIIVEELNILSDDKYDGMEYIIVDGNYILTENIDSYNKQSMSKSIDTTVTDEYGHNHEVVAFRSEDEAREASILVLAEMAGMYNARVEKITNVLKLANIGLVHSAELPKQTGGNKRAKLRVSK